MFALEALGWALTDEKRAERLRHGIDDRSVQAAVLDFLAGHEPDLVAAADALNTKPETLVAAAKELNA